MTILLPRCIKNTLHHIDGAVDFNISSFFVHFCKSSRKAALFLCNPSITPCTSRDIICASANFRFCGHNLADWYTCFLLMLRWPILQFFVFLCCKVNTVSKSKVVNWTHELTIHSSFDLF